MFGRSLGLALVPIECLVPKYGFDFSIRAIVSDGAVSPTAISWSMADIARISASRQCVLVVGTGARVRNSGPHVPIRTAPTSHVESIHVIFVLPDEQARFKPMCSIITNVTIRCSTLWHAALKRV
jgi:hypothetical protein